MTTYYKATRPDGFSFNGIPPVSYTRKDGTPRTSVIRPAPYGGEPRLCGPGVLHVADTPTGTLLGGSWPCRLFEVEPVGEPLGREGHMFGFAGLRIVREVEAWRALGPQGREVAALIARAGVLTPAEAQQLAAAGIVAAWAAARAAARDGARAAARIAASRAAAWDAAWAAAARAAAWTTAARAAAARDAAWDAARALVTRDLIGQHGYTQDHYDTLTRPWRQVIGPIHPDDDRRRA